MQADLNPETTIESQPDKAGFSHFVRSFKDHPASVGETYWGHMAFALRFSARLLKIAGAALLHAIVPAWCETTASREISALHAEMMARHSQGHDNHTG